MSILNRAFHCNELLRSRRARYTALAGYLFILPAILGIVLLVFGPMIATLVISLMNWSVFSSPT